MAIGKAMIIAHPEACDPSRIFVAGVERRVRRGPALERFHGSTHFMVGEAEKWFRRTHSGV
jgi:hypothetical protein